MASDATQGSTRTAETRYIASMNLCARMMLLTPSKHKRNRRRRIQISMYESRCKTSNKILCNLFTHLLPSNPAFFRYKKLNFVNICLTTGMHALQRRRVAGVRCVPRPGIHGEEILTTCTFIHPTIHLMIHKIDTLDFSNIVISNPVFSRTRNLIVWDLKIENN